MWWLPHSYNSQAMNFYLIDVPTIAFSLVVLGRRLIWLLLRLLIITVLPVSPQGRWESKIIVITTKIFVIIILIRFVNGSKFCTIGLILFILGYLVFFIQQSHSMVNILYLVYPVSVYFILFRCSASPFIDLSPGGQAGGLTISIIVSEGFGFSSGQL